MKKPTEPAELSCFGHPYRETVVPCLELAVKPGSRSDGGTCNKAIKERIGLMRGFLTRLKKLDLALPKTYAYREVNDNSRDKSQNFAFGKP